MRLAIVIVNYRTAELTGRAVATALGQLPEVGPARVVVVDNDSGDGSFERLQALAASEGWGERATLVRAPHNGGYGSGINVAVRALRAGGDAPEYVYVLNPDAFPAPGTLRRLVEFMDAHPQVGIAGNDIRDEAGTSQCGAFRFPSPYSEIEGNARLSLVSALLGRHAVALPTPVENDEVDWISGASMMIRRRVLDEVGLFDEGFFLYFEEVDFCRRARAAGWRVAFVAGAPVAHVGSASTGMADGARPMPGYWFASRHRYLHKHHGRFYAAACDAGWIAGHLLWRAKRLARPGDAPSRPHLLRDFTSHALRALVRRDLPGGPPTTS